MSHDPSSLIEKVLPSAELAPGTPEAEAAAPVQASHGPLQTTVIKGAAAVIARQASLSSLSERSGYPGAMDDLAYFVGKPGAVEAAALKIRSYKRLPRFLMRICAAALRRWVGREPVLILIHGVPTSSRMPQADDLVGALLLYEYRLLGFRTRLLTTNDRSGHRSFVAATGSKPAALNLALRQVCRDGGQVVLLSVHKEAGAAGEALQSVIARPDVPRSRSCMQERKRKAFLPLLEDLDATFAQCGTRTRKNLRQYRRKAEAELACVFEENLRINREDFLTMNRTSMYAVPDDVALWRYAHLVQTPSATLGALKDSHGRYLSLIGYRRWDSTAEIMWQMNVDAYPELSLSLVARSFLIEREIARGSRKLQIEGGTAHALTNAFCEEDLLDMLLLRRTMRARVIRSLAKRTIQEGDELGRLLARDDLAWNSN